MEVTELYELTKWVEEKVTPEGDDNLLDKYVHFIEAMQNSQGGNYPFELQREALEDALERINFLSLTREQKNFLEKINVLQALGLPAIKKIEDILTRNNLDIATAISKIQEMHTNLEEGIGKLNAIRDGLEDYISDDHDEFPVQDGILTGISFVENASIHSVYQLKSSTYD